MDQTEILHTMYSLRVAIACLYAAMPPEQQQKATGYMSQHILLIEESRDVGMAGAQKLMDVMDAQFESIHKAARIDMHYMKPQGQTKRPRKSKDAK